MIAWQLFGYSVLVDAQRWNFYRTNEMANLYLYLPEELQQLVNSQDDAGEFEIASAYIEALNTRAKEGNEKLEALPIERLESGEPIPLDDNEWKRFCGDVTGRLSNGQ